MKVNELFEEHTGSSDADGGGVLGCLQKAKDNMSKHSTSHPDADIKRLCGDTHAQLAKFSASPNAMYDDPHTLVKLLQTLHKDPTKHIVQSVLTALSSYSPSDSD